MGVYYKAVCDRPRERIEPARINDGTVKWPNFARPGEPFPNILAYVMAGRWFGGKVRLVSDSGDAVDYDDETYVDVTEEVVGEFAETFPEAQAKYRPKRD